MNSRITETKNSLTTTPGGNQPNFNNQTVSLGNGAKARIGIQCHKVHGRALESLAPRDYNDYKKLTLKMNQAVCSTEPNKWYIASDYCMQLMLLGVDMRSGILAGWITDLKFKEILPFDDLEWNCQGEHEAVLDYIRKPQKHNIFNEMPSSIIHMLSRFIDDKSNTSTCRLYFQTLLGECYSMGYISEKTLVKELGKVKAFEITENSSKAKLFRNLKTTLKEERQKWFNQPRHENEFESTPKAKL